MRKLSAKIEALIKKHCECVESKETGNESWFFNGQRVMFANKKDVYFTCSPNKTINQIKKKFIKKTKPLIKKKKG